MIRSTITRLGRLAWPLALLLGVTTLGSAAALAADVPAHESFDTPKAAVRALYRATRQGDLVRLRALFGEGSDDLLDSGDPVADKRERSDFLNAYRVKHHLVVEGDDRQLLAVGAGDWLLPTPLVRRDGRWQFDGAAGADELVYRRIGENELGAIAVCKGIVVAQADYHLRNPEHAAQPHYAGRFLSDAGRRNGLYWDALPGEKPSPAGEFIANASAEGYEAGHGRPYHGYNYRLLDSQGAAAEGGARTYAVDGVYTQGYAVVAWPAQYRASGVMTFIVNQNGVIYQKDLGEDTETLARAMHTFDPGEGWTPVDAP